MLNVLKYTKTYLTVFIAVTAVNLLAYMQSLFLGVDRPVSGYIIPSIIGTTIGFLFSANRVRLIEKSEEQRRQLLNIVQALSIALDERDAYTFGHSERVTTYSLELGRRAGLSQAELDMLEVGSILHDIGKIGISDTILNKPGELSEKEIDFIKQHTVKGERILGQSRELKSSHFIACIRSHHERFDGRGYPDGLQGANIPIMARIIAISDTFDAMTSMRPYRHKATVKEALEELKRCSGSQFDPRLVSIFYEMMSGDQLDQSLNHSVRYRLQPTPA